MTIRMVSNDPPPGPLEENDYVTVVLDSKGFQGYVVNLDEGWIRLRVHKTLPDKDHAAIDERCEAKEVAIPTSKVLYVAFPNQMPTGCYCSQGIYP